MNPVCSDNDRFEETRSAICALYAMYGWKFEIFKCGSESQFGTYVIFDGFQVCMSISTMPNLDYESTFYGQTPVESLRAAVDVVIESDSAFMKRRVHVPIPCIEGAGCPTDLAYMTYENHIEKLVFDLGSFRGSVQSLLMYYDLVKGSASPGKPIFQPMVRPTT